MDGGQWLEALHLAHYDMLVRLARCLLRDSAASECDAEDVVQQAFVLAAQKQISGHEAPERWLICTVRNLCMNCAAKGSRTAQKTQRIARERPDNVGAE